MRRNKQLLPDAEHFATFQACEKHLTNRLTEDLCSQIKSFYQSPADESRYRLFYNYFSQRRKNAGNVYFYENNQLSHQGVEDSPFLTFYFSCPHEKQVDCVFQFSFQTGLIHFADVTWSIEEFWDFVTQKNFNKIGKSTHHSLVCCDEPLRAWLHSSYLNIPPPGLKKHKK